MNILLVLLVLSVLIIDFLSIHKHDMRTVFVYMGIVILILTVTVLDKYDALEMSPVEMIIETLTPLLDWISETLRCL